MSLNARTSAGNASALEIPLNIPPGGRSRIVALQIDVANDHTTESRAPVVNIIQTAGTVAALQLPSVAPVDGGQFWVVFDGGPSQINWLNGSMTQALSGMGLRAWWDDNDQTKVRIEMQDGRVSLAKLWTEDLPPAQRRRRVTSSGDMTAPG